MVVLVFVVVQGNMHRSRPGASRSHFENPFSGAPAVRPWMHVVTNEMWSTSLPCTFPFTKTNTSTATFPPFYPRLINKPAPDLTTAPVLQGTYLEAP